MESSPDRQARGRRGMVVSVSQPATDVGLAVLADGGNAVDAAVAVGFALAVTHPPAGNIGGGGFMLVQPVGKPAVCLDYRETAPAAAMREMFAKDDRRHTHKQVGVPGTVLGLAAAHRKFGKLKWKRLVEPAVKLAADGFAMDEPLAESLNQILAESPGFAELQRVFTHPNRRPWKSGDRLVQSDLAATLEEISNRRAAAFYDGPIAEKLVAEMKTGGGMITRDDLKAYRAKSRRPVSTTFRGASVIGPPPPSSGGIVLAEMLNVLEHFPLKKQGRFSPKTLHVLIETMKRAYRDRAAYLGDADFVKIPARLTTKKYAAKLAAGIRPNHATPSADLADGIKIAGGGDSTTHFSVIDADGLAVANTYTLEQSYGSRIVVRGAGFLLNNEMGDFNPRPGHTDRKGRIGTPANDIAPGKRMLSSQCPTIVTRDGRPLLITGSPGGRTIINTVLCMVLNVLEFEMHLLDAVDAARLHHQWLPDMAFLEQRDGRPSQEAMAKLHELGHETKIRQNQGAAHSIRIIEGECHGVADRRRFLGTAAGL